MSTSKNFIAYVLDQLNDPKARIKAMFGEYALYYDERVVSLICDDTVFLKITPRTTTLLPNAQSGPPYPGSKDFYIVTDLVEDRERFLKLLQQCAADVPAKKAKKKVLKQK